MNHPEELLIMARLYHTQKIQEAEARRQAKKVMGADLGVWRKLTGKLQSLKIQPKRTRAGEPNILESVN